MNDKSGKRQFVLNAFVSWGVHIFIVIAGFIVPRQIDHSLGAEQLGIWDFGWSTVQYMTLTGFGVGAALNRYVSMYRAAENNLLLVRITTAAFVWQSFVAIIVLVITVTVCLTLPYWAQISSEDALRESQTVTFLLGLSLTIKMFFDYTGGVLSGYHYWWILNSLIAFQDFMLAVIMVGILLLGGDLIDLATAVVVVSCIMAISKLYLVKRFCPDVSISISQWRKSQAKELLLFGVKNLISRSNQIVLFQTAAMLLMAFVNPVALAIFNRCLALIRHIDVFLRKLITMLVPITSGLIGMKKADEARGMVIQATQLSMCLTLLGILMLCVFGDVILELWMGSDYASRTLMIILATGAIVPLGTSGSHSILAGFNAHGKMVGYTLAITITLMFVGSFIVNAIEWNVINVAVLCAIAWSFSKLITLPYYVKKNFDIGYLSYAKQVLLKPALLNVPYVSLLLIARLLYTYNQYVLMLLAVLGSALVTLLIYWKYLFTEGIRKQLANGFNDFVVKKIRRSGA